MKYIKLFEDYEYEEEFEACPTCDCNPCKCDEMSHEEEEFDEDEFGGEFEDEDEFGNEFEDEEEDEFAEKFEAKKAKPDFLDIDKDGNKKESMKKAAKDAKEKKSDKKEDKKEKGLSAAQKKLPAGLRAAIARKAAKGKAKD